MPEDKGNLKRQYPKGKKDDMKDYYAGVKGSLGDRARNKALDIANSLANVISGSSKKKPK